VDHTGRYETVIIINTSGQFRTPNEKSNWDDLAANEVLFCPDLIDYGARAIIEFEEESKPQKGAKIIKKGHFEESKKDTRRDEAYKKAGFEVLKVWETEPNKNAKIRKFLTDVYSIRRKK